MALEPFIGEIIMVGFNFAPRGWALCNGQLLSISQNTALFSLIGTNYGGDGRLTFALPDLRGRVPLHQGQRAGFSSYVIGEQGGSETVTLLQTQMPSHTHLLGATNAEASQTSPTGQILAQARETTYGSGTPTVNMSAQAIALTGGSQPHENRPPYLVINFVIALEGVFPPRN
jgi:microcystin-dependent protein